MSGKIIVIEGIDGSGKNTQAKLLQQALDARQVHHKLWHFPLYQETFFGKEVAQYLNGEYGSLEHTHPKLTALLYAGDRYEKRDELLYELEQGTTILLDRYVPSNIAHQGAKLDVEAFAEFQAWVEELEYGVFGLPRPHLTMFLDMPPEIAYKLVLEKSKREYTDKKQDLHEENASYLQKVYNNFMRLSEEQGWKRIACYEGNQPCDVNTIHQKILQEVNKIV